MTPTRPRLFLFLIFFAAFALFAALGGGASPAGQVTSSSSSPKPAAASGGARNSSTIMLTDQDLLNALQEKSNIVFAKVLSSRVLIPGTRGQRTEYQIVVSQTLTGQGEGIDKATHYGQPLLTTGKSYAIVLAPTSRFPGAQQIRAWAEVPEGQEAGVSKMYAERLQHLGHK